MNINTILIYNIVRWVFRTGAASAAIARTRLGGLSILILKEAPPRNVQISESVFVVFSVTVGNKQASLSLDAWLLWFVSAARDRTEIKQCIFY